jgi:hypothetical protein
MISFLHYNMFGHYFWPSSCSTYTVPLKFLCCPLSIGQCSQLGRSYYYCLQCRSLVIDLEKYFKLYALSRNRKRHFQHFFIAAGTSLLICYLATIEGYTGTHTTVLLLCVFIATGTYLLSCCLAMKGGIHFTEPLASSDKRDSHTETQTDQRDL